MNSSRLIEHPLERFSLTGSLRDLDCTGRDATDKLMTMIDDMRFRKDSIWGTCARYFLLIDLSWFPQLCLSAQINSEKLRAYLWLCERGEIKHIFGDAGTVVPFLRKRGQSRVTHPADKVVPSGPFAAGRNPLSKTDDDLNLAEQLQCGSSVVSAGLRVKGEISGPSSPLSLVESPPQPLRYLSSQIPKS